MRNTESVTKEKRCKKHRTEKQIALLEIVHAVEHYFEATELSMIEAGDALPGPNLPEYDVESSSPFFHWMTKWTGMLDPGWLETLAELRESEVIVQNALPDHAEVKHAFRTISDGFCNVSMPVYRLGYYLGILVGMHAMHANHEQLVVKAERIARFLDQQGGDL